MHIMSELRSGDSQSAPPAGRYQKYESTVQIGSDTHGSYSPVSKYQLDEPGCGTGVVKKNAFRVPVLSGG